MVDTTNDFNIKFLDENNNEIDPIIDIDLQSVAEGHLLAAIQGGVKYITMTAGTTTKKYERYVDDTGCASLKEI